MLERASPWVQQRDRLRRDGLRDEIEQFFGALDRGARLARQLREADPRADDRERATQEVEVMGGETTQIGTALPEPVTSMMFSSISLRALDRSRV